jgi:hypothetical protein
VAVAVVGYGETSLRVDCDAGHGCCIQKSHLNFFIWSNLIY